MSVGKKVVSRRQNENRWSFLQAKGETKLKMMLWSDFLGFVQKLIHHHLGRHGDGSIILGSGETVMVIGS